MLAIRSEEQDGRGSWQANSGGGVDALLLLGMLGTALAFVAMSSLSARVGSTRSASLTYLEAIVALIMGVIVQVRRFVFSKFLGASCFWWARGSCPEPTTRPSRVQRRA